MSSNSTTGINLGSGDKSYVNLTTLSRFVNFENKSSLKELLIATVAQ